MANIKITELNAASSLAANDVLPVVDISTDETKKITSTNLFRTLPDGTAAAPALAFSSDQANGIYLAGTDTVGITTGGTQRVTVDASGNVVISGDLTVQGATTTVESTTVTIDDKNIELGSVASPSNTTADGGGITLKGASDKTIKWINSTGCWTFNQPTNFNNHVRIDSSGNVGIGTSSPSSGKALTLNSSSNYYGINFQTAGTNIGNIIQESTGAFYISTNQSSGQLIFRSGAQSEAMRIDSSGRLLVGTSTSYNAPSITGTQYASLNQTHSATAGIGSQLIAEWSTSTATGGSSLKLAKSNSGTVGTHTALTANMDIGSLVFAASDGSNFINAATILAEVDGTPGTNDMPGRLVFSTTADGASSPTERLRIDSSGNVTFKNSNYVSFNDNGYIRTDSTGYLRLQMGSNGTMFTNASNSEVARIDSSGRLGVGDSSPANTLSVLGPSTAGGGSTGNVAEFAGPSNTNGFQVFVNDSNNNSGIQTKNADAFVINPFGGSVGIGTTSPSSNLDIEEAGASANAELAINYTGSGSGRTSAIRFQRGGSNFGFICGATFALTSGNNDDLAIAPASGKNLLFGIGNSEKVRIDSSGNVGIGTTSPRAKTEVYDSSVSGAFVPTTLSTWRVLQVRNNIESNTGTAAGIALGGDGSSDTETAGIVGISSNSTGGVCELALLYASGNASKEGLRIDSSGNVGVGVSSPLRSLHIAGAGDTGLMLQTTNAVDNNEIWEIQVAGNASNLADLIFRSRTNAGTGGSEAMRIDSSGRLLVGTTAGAYKLVVSGGVATTGIVASILNPVSGGNSKIHFSDNATYNWTAGTVGNAFAITPTEASTSAGTPALFINSSGNVGINDSSPSSLGTNITTVEVKGGSATRSGGIRLSTSDDSQKAAFYVYDGAGIVGTETAHPLGLYTGNTERMRIDSSGRLLVGTTTANGNMTVNMGTDKNISFNGSQGEVGNVPALVATNNSGSSLASMGFRATDLRFATGSAERFRITSTGAFAIEGASNYGTSGQVLTSNGNDAPTWQSAGQASIGGANAISMNDNVNINFGASNDLQIYHDGSHSYIKNATGNLYFQHGGENMAQFSSDGAVELYYNNSKKFETKSDGVDITGELQCDSLDCDGGADFTGDAVFRGGAAAVNIAGNSDIRFINGNWTGNSCKIQHHNNILYISGGTGGIAFREDGSDRCFIDGSGNFNPSSNNTYDLGTSSLRWRNVYTNDLNLSNEGSANDVDGTWGNYTIQEGEDDLFLINRRNGKKYKFNLTEVS